MDDHSNQKSATARSFGDSADGYRVSEMHREGADLDTLAAWCEESTRALDVATGAGHTASALAAAGVPTVVASDASPSMVATTRASFPDVRGVVTDAERLPLAADSFDAVTCRIAAHHFPDPQTFVEEVARVLRPGSTFALEDNVAPEDEALDVFVNELEAMRDPTHLRSHKTSTWQQWLEDTGFAVEDTDHLMKTLEYEQWMNRIGALDESDRDAVHRFLLDASDEAVDFFDVEYDDNGAVDSFGSLKALIRGVRQ